MRSRRWLLALLVGVGALAVVVVVVAGAGGEGAGGAPQSRIPGRVVPRAEARRIAAEFEGAGAYLPRRVPRGFAFSSWTTTEDCGACGRRLVVHFAHGRSDLKWEAFFEDLGRPWLRCRHQRFVVGVVDGRIVSYRRRRGIETAWVCVHPHYHEIVSVSHRVDGQDDLSPGDLEHMVASAHAQPPGRARGSRYELPARAVTRRIAAAYGSPAFLPKRLPRGFIFTRWKVRARDTDEGNRRSMLVKFGRDGLLLYWRVLGGVDTYGFECPRNGSVPDAQRTFVSHGRRIFFAAGIHGASAWSCIRRHAVGNARPLQVDLWYDIRLDGRAMRRLAVRMVGTARLVRPR
jgi:hypothetical protein